VGPAHQEKYGAPENSRRRRFHLRFFASWRLGVRF
jgi:hypothetical protein